VSFFNIKMHNTDIIPTDVDECEEFPNGGCDHICTNTNGSYNCSCHDGYDLEMNDVSCIGMCPLKIPNFLVYLYI